MGHPSRRRPEEAEIRGVREGGRGRWNPWNNVMPCFKRPVMEHRRAWVGPPEFCGGRRAQPTKERAELHDALGRWDAGKGGKFVGVGAYTPPREPVCSRKSASVAPGMAVERDGSKLRRQRGRGWRRRGQQAAQGLRQRQWRRRGRLQQVALLKGRARKQPVGPVEGAPIGRNETTLGGGNAGFAGAIIATAPAAVGDAMEDYLTSARALAAVNCNPGDDDWSDVFSDKRIGRRVEHRGDRS